MCCLFGLIDYGRSLSGRQKDGLIRALAAASEARGTDAAGIAYNSGGRLRIYKRPGPAHKLHISLPEDALVVMGHTRMTTQGSEKWNRNNHPFAGKAGNTRFALAHNGVLYNDKSLRSSRKLPQTGIQTDSYIAVQLLEQLGALTPDSLKEMAETVEGSFVFTVLDERDRLYLVKGNNPMTIYHYPRLGLYVYASTQAILHQVTEHTWLAHELFREVIAADGDILRFDRQGPVVAGRFIMPQPVWYPWHPCAGAVPCSHQPDPSYLRTLKNIAASFGYAPEDIDDLLAAGYTTDEIEEELYSFDWPAYR